MLCLCGVLRRWCPGHRVVCWRAGLLGVPVGGGPPASRPRRELRSARRLEARPGPATAHGHRSLALHPSGALHTGGDWCTDVWLCASSRSPARPRHRPLAPRQIPPAPSMPVGPGVLACGLVRWVEARPGSEAVSAISHVIPLRIFQTMNSYRWGFNVSGPC